MSRTKSDFPTKSKLIQSIVTPNEFKYFKECAEKEGLTLSTLIRIALIEHLDNK